MNSSENIRKTVQSEFNKIREAINVREQLLLRQLDVICNSNQSYLNKNNINGATTTTFCPTHDLNNLNGSYNNNKNNNDIDEIKFISDNETILSLIRNFGKFNLENMNVNFTNLLYINEDEPEHDTPSMVKCLENVTKMTNNSTTLTPSTTNRSNGEEGDGVFYDFIDCNEKNIDVESFLNENDEKLFVDFSNNKKIISQNVSNLNESVINITLNEAKELIEKSSIVLQPNCIKNESSTNTTTVGETKSLTSDIKSSVVSSKSSTTTTTHITKTTIESKKQKKSFRLKPKITINNCNGVINLKNISSLTINCANKDLMNVPHENNNCSNSDDAQNNNDIDSIAESVQIYSVTDNGNSTNNTENFDTISENSDNNTVTTTTSSGTLTATTKEDNDNYVNCEFYNRLIAEIKNTLKQQQHQHAKAHCQLLKNANNNLEINDVDEKDNNNCIDDSIHVEELQLSAGESSTTITLPNTSNSTTVSSKRGSNKSKKLLLKNLENLKIILEKSEDDSQSGGGDSNDSQSGGGDSNKQGRPVQIEQWLAEIISETEIEPMLNSEILELSKLQSGTVTTTTTSTCERSNLSTS